MLLVSHQGECQPACWRASQGLMGKINRNISPWLTLLLEDGSKEAPVIIDIDHDDNGELAGEDDLDDDTNSLLILFDIVKVRDME